MNQKPQNLGKCPKKLQSKVYPRVPTASRISGLSRISGQMLKTYRNRPEILDKFERLSGEENRWFWAILGKNLTVSGLNMTQNACYHLNKV